MTSKISATVDVDGIVILQADPDDNVFSCGCPVCDDNLKFNLVNLVSCSCGMTWDITLKATGKRTDDPDQPSMF